MLNQREFERGLADEFVKFAIMVGGWPAIREGGKAGLRLSGKVLSAVVPDSIEQRAGNWVGENVIGPGLDMFTRNPSTTPGQPGQPTQQARPAFLDGISAGTQKSYVGSQGQLDLGNKVLDQATGGSVQLGPGNKPNVDFGKAISHFGGQAVDWIKNNPGKSLLGGGALLGGGMLLHNALSGGNDGGAPAPGPDPEPQQPQRRFAFAKPGITG